MDRKNKEQIFQLTIQKNDNYPVILNFSTNKIGQPRNNRICWWMKKFAQ